jgi:TetR/AcrR family transcriptional repressor of nem operon
MLSSGDLTPRDKGVGMRVSKQKAAENRERLLSEAARLFRERGLSGVGVDALAEASGLSYGGLYSQFGSKDRLAAEALNHAVAASAAKFSGTKTIGDYVWQYLSPEHRERRGDGCAMAALGCEMPRQSGPVRHSFTQGVRSMLDRLAKLLPAGPAREDDALVFAATLVGALVLARGVDDPELSDRILGATTQCLIQDRPAR